jgi:membrane-associated phospholipid phosphatase
VTPKQCLRSAAIAFALALACMLLVDQPVARWVATHETYPRVWNEILGYLEYGLGIEPYEWIGTWILAAGTIITLAVPQLRRAAFAFALVALVHFTGRNLSLWLKLGFGRYRPTQWLKHGGGATFWHHDAWSFPSGHAILFGSIVVPLVVCYPRLWPLLGVVVYAITARVAVDAHFVSDVLAGYALIALLTWAYVRLLRRTLASSTRPASLR